MIGVVAALMLQLVVGVATVTPPTEFLAKAEGDSFVATLRGALDKLSPSWRRCRSVGCRVVHLLGASEAEDLVDWSSLCEMANPPSLVLIGPQVVERQTGSCVHSLKGLYSHDKVHKRHKAVPALSTPDLIPIYNADLYSCPWRRTLVELLQSGRPVVLTTYCENEDGRRTFLIQSSCRRRSKVAMRSSGICQFTAFKRRSMARWAGALSHGPASCGRSRRTQMLPCRPSRTVTVRCGTATGWLSTVPQQVPKRSSSRGGARARGIQS